jgi:hypothetical protein
VEEAAQLLSTMVDALEEMKERRRTAEAALTRRDPGAH